MSEYDILTINQHLQWKSNIFDQSRGGMVLNLFQLSRSQVTLTLLSELHTNHLVAELLGLGFALGFLYFVF